MQPLLPNSNSAGSTGLEINHQPAVPTALLCSSSDSMLTNHTKLGLDSHTPQTDTPPQAQHKGGGDPACAAIFTLDDRAAVCCRHCCRTFTLLAAQE